MGTAAMAVGARDLTLGLDFLQADEGREDEAAVRQPRGHGGQAPLPGLHGGDGGRGEVRAWWASRPRARGRTSPGWRAARRARRAGRGPTACATRRRWTWWWCSPPCLTRTTVQLAQEAEGVDFVVQSHESRVQGMAQRNGFATLVPHGRAGPAGRPPGAHPGGHGALRGPLRARGGPRRASRTSTPTSSRRRSGWRRRRTRRPGRRLRRRSPASSPGGRPCMQVEPASGATSSGPHASVVLHPAGRRHPGRRHASRRRVERIEPPGSACH